ncbi:archaellin/type IV pilin N-terminal domain-containing protein [Halorubellus litoreus]|uniref:Flagellin n=1 Tax=Halorubellus litoreus TaxID=755308 RepID=A0ABD5VFI7_9EURY
MFDAIDTNERGQVGIGTLIIFIAMVLVAAVAAGVLINTAGLLESTASDTGQDSQAQVSNQLTVVSASGHIDSGNVSSLNFTVMKSSGSGDIDLSAATVQLKTDEVSKTLTFANDTAAGARTFAVYEINDTDINNPLHDGPDGASVVLDSSSDRRVVRIDLNTMNNQLAELQEGEEATVTFVDQSGASTIYGVNVPNTISDETTVAV